MNVGTTGTMSDSTWRDASDGNNNPWRSNASQQQFGSTVCFILHGHLYGRHDINREKQRFRWRAPSCICCSSRPPEDVGNSAARARVLRAGERESARASSHSFDAGLDVDFDSSLPLVANASFNVCIRQTNVFLFFSSFRERSLCSRDETMRRGGLYFLFHFVA